MSLHWKQARTVAASAALSSLCAASPAFSGGPGDPVHGGPDSEIDLSPGLVSSPAEHLKAEKTFLMDSELADLASAKASLVLDVLDGGERVTLYDESGETGEFIIDATLCSEFDLSASIFGVTGDLVRAHANASVKTGSWTASGENLETFSFGPTVKAGEHYIEVGGLEIYHSTELFGPTEEKVLTHPLFHAEYPLSIASIPLVVKVEVGAEFETSIRALGSGSKTKPVVRMWGDMGGHVYGSGSFALDLVVTEVGVTAKFEVAHGEADIDRKFNKTGLHGKANLVLEPLKLDLSAFVTYPTITDEWPFVEMKTESQPLYDWSAQGEVLPAEIVPFWGEFDGESVFPE